MFVVVTCICSPTNESFLAPAHSVLVELGIMIGIIFIPELDKAFFAYGCVLSYVLVE